ncbi:MAG: VTT domain-containing protein [Patescibacteria group bacterium]|mgnify:CR=1 FL=1
MKIDRKIVIFWVWVAVIVGALYFYIFQNDLITRQSDRISDLPLFWRGLIYLVLGCIRGAFFIPVTYLILLGLVFLPAWPAYILTMIGVMVSSMYIYNLAEYLNVDEYFKNKHSKAINKLTNVLKKNELPIVIGWSFFPFTPTDVMCYVCGTLEINIKKFLLGIFIGESISCAIYIFAGKDLLLFVTKSIFGS